MKISKIQKGLVFGVLSAMAFLAGCELIVDFDRTKIPVDTADVEVPGEGGSPVDGGTDDATPGDDAGDAGDASDDAPSDAAADG